MNITDKQKKLIHMVSDIVISFMLALTRILFSVSCYSVYSSAEKQMFTYESIGRAFDKIDVIVYITLAIVVIGAIISILLPKEEKKLKSPRRIKTVYSNLSKRVDVSKLDNDGKNAILKERKLRKTLLIVNAVIAALTVLLPLIYLLNPNTFPAENGKYNSEISQGLLWYICMLLPLIIYEILYYVLKNRSISRETELLKELIKGGANAPVVPDKAEKSFSEISNFFANNEKPITLGVRIAFIGCALLFITLGIINGGMGDVLVKAVNICAECIGLG